MRRKAIDIHALLAKRPRNRRRGGGIAMKASKPYLRAIAANLEALWSILDSVLKDVGDGLEAAGQGNQDGAAGAIILAEEQLRQAGILVQAILVLHRQR